MPESFDPYRKWLGIPEQERPPDHYRLLGIELFESDADVISNAVDGRMAQLKNYQTGKYSVYSQKLLNEIAAAKVCLLHPSRKAEYDRQLKQRDEERGTRNKGEQQEEAVMEIAEIPSFMSAQSFSYTHRASRKQSRWLMPLVMAGGAVLFIVFLAFWTRENSNNIAAKQARFDPAPSQPNPPATVKTDVFKPATVSEKPSPVPEEKKPKKPVKEAEPAQLMMKDPTPPVEEPAVEKPVLADQKPKKLPMPDEEEQKAAEAKIRDIFGREMADAKKADQKLALAAKFLKQSSETTDDPDVRFVLLRMAATLASEAGELAEAFRTVDTMAEGYELDPLNVKTVLLAKAVEANRSGGKADNHPKAMLDAAEVILNEALAADNYELAGKILKTASTVARAAKDPQLIRDTAARSREVERLKAKFAAIKTAMDTLADNSDDADANLTVGQWYCLVKGDWEKGLPLLQKGSEKKLAKPAGQDLAQPKDPKEQTALADAWWELSESALGQAKASLQARAAHWYETALPKLAGLEKAKAEKRLGSLAAAAGMEEKTSAGGANVRGIVQKGNVALASDSATVIGIPEHPEQLLDGNTTAYNYNSGYSAATVGQPFTVVLRRVYQLREIRVLFWDYKPSSYNYIIATSIDGKKFAPVVDHSQGAWTGWQLVSFSPRPVKYIRVYPIRRIRLSENGTETKRFLIVELEAYCIPPDNR